VRGANLSSFRMHWGRAGAADISKGTAVFDTANGFQAVLHLGEATDSLARDATVNAYHATPANAGSVNPVDTAGVIGRAKGFRRVSSTASSYFNLAGTASGKLNFAQGGPFTLSVWANYYFVNSSHIISKDERQYSLGRRTGGTQWEIKQMTEGEGKQYIQSTPGLTNAWQYIVGVRNGDQMALYVDGVLAGDAILVDGSSTNRVTTGDVQLGRCPDAGTVATGTTAATCNYMPGAVDEVILSNQARSAAWIKLSYETQKPGARSVLTDTMPIPLAITGAGHDRTPGFTGRMTGTGMQFRLPEGVSAGRLTVLDLQGRTVWNVNTTAGATSVLWSGLTASGRHANAGVYFARFVPGSGAASLETKVTLTR
jgi:hypothetical protein